MNVGVISSSACAHQLAQLLAKNDKVFHFGANLICKETSTYKPFYYNFSQIDNPDKSLIEAETKIKECKLDYVLTTGVALPFSDFSQSFFKRLKIPCFFPEKKLLGLEGDKFACKKILQKIGLPVQKGLEVDGVFLKENFKIMARPYVLKFKRYMYGRQTIIINDDNVDEFEKELFDNNHYMFIHDTDSLVIEEFLNIKKEYSYHCIVNKNDWKYIGSARDYKAHSEGDKGYNTASMGAYSTNDINPIIHTYVEKLLNHLKNSGYFYKGFLFLGIAEDIDGNPYILEINTRAGDPEIIPILNSIENNVAELLYYASTDKKIPEIKFKNNKTVSVRLINSSYNWNEPAIDLPKIENVPSNILFGIEGTDRFTIKHSLFTAESNTYENASNIIFNFLKNQYVGQFRYRTDIGILK